MSSIRTDGQPRGKRAKGAEGALSRIVKASPLFAESTLDKKLLSILKTEVSRRINNKSSQNVAVDSSKIVRGLGDRMTDVLTTMRGE